MEISTISVGRMNNGAHYLYNVDFYSRIDADTAVKGKLTGGFARLQTSHRQ